jgi:hypothetical protein
MEAAQGSVGLRRVGDARGFGRKLHSDRGEYETETDHRKELISGEHHRLRLRKIADLALRLIDTPLGSLQH